MTNTLLALLIGIVAGVLLLAAGYLGGVERGRAARDALRRQLRGGAGERDDQELRQAIRELLGPLVRRESLGNELASLPLATGDRGELPGLLDDIAQRGGFSAVLLSDEAGLPLATSSGSDDLDRLAGVSSLVMLVADRLARDTGPAPVAVIVHDEADQQLLSRLFPVAGQTLLLTAVATGATLAPTSLDPALAKIEAVLAPAATG